MAGQPGGPHDGNEWKKYCVLPRAHPSRTLFYACFNRSGSTGAFSFPGATWDRFRCTMEPSPGHILCRDIRFFWTSVWCIPEFGTENKSALSRVFSFFCSFERSRAISKPAPNPSAHQIPVETLSKNKARKIRKGENSSRADKDLALRSWKPARTPPEHQKTQSSSTVTFQSLSGSLPQSDLKVTPKVAFWPEKWLKSDFFGSKSHFWGYF